MPLIQSTIKQSFTLCSTLLCCAMLFSHTAQANRFADTQITSTDLGQGLYFLSGAGGNMASLISEDKVLLVDSQFAEMADKINTTLLKLSNNQPLTALINTHMHGDHVGGNAALASNLPIIAHYKVRQRLADNAQFDPAGLPNTLIEEQSELQVGAYTLNLQPMPASHTDGDLLVWFTAHNAVHMGDLMFQGRFPFVDTNNGGNVQQYIENTRYVIAKIDDNTRVIPGHGELTNKAGLTRELYMMESTLAEVKVLKDSGITLEQAIERGLSEQWQSWHWNFITEARWITTLWQALP
ncbi:MBL fold metallo-hydrolase [Arsukibacterium sp.]|uniref:MBL fold metallo-hydrolase n=1 Tax=Arsukibacterium sp. TaxID=1977258 RepID=UPI002FDAB958